MPKTKLQELIFTLMMVPVMVTWMVLYNLWLSPQGLTGVSARTGATVLELCALALAVEFPLISPAAHAIAFRIARRTSCSPTLLPVVVALCMVSLMCPYMSFLAMLLQPRLPAEWASVWGGMLRVNYPMALAWQLLVAGPAVRATFASLQKRFWPADTPAA